MESYALLCCIWCAFGDSNPGPDGYEPSALPTELKAHIKCSAFAEVPVKLFDRCTQQIRNKSISFSDLLEYRSAMRTQVVLAEAHERRIAPRTVQKVTCLHGWIASFNNSNGRDGWVRTSG